MDKEQMVHLQQHPLPGMATLRWAKCSISPSISYSVAKSDLK